MEESRNIFAREYLSAGTLRDAGDPQISDSPSDCIGSTIHTAVLLSVQINERLRLTARGVESLDAVSAGGETVIIGQNAATDSVSPTDGGSIRVAAGLGRSGGKQGALRFASSAATFVSDGLDQATLSIEPSAVTIAGHHRRELLAVPLSSHCAVRIILHPQQPV